MLKKYKKLPLILTGLAGVALLTTGFSAWVISSTTAASSNDMVNITVGEVTDKRVKASLTATEKIIKFDSNKKGGTNKIKGTSENEDMVFGGTVTIGLSNPSEQPTNDTDIETILSSVKFELTENQSSSKYPAYQKAKAHLRLPSLDPSGDKLTYTINKPTETEPESNDPWNNTTLDHTIYHKKGTENQNDYVKTHYDVSLIQNKNQITVEFEFGFGWGQVFEYVNPCDAKFENDSNDTNLNAAIAALGDLKELNEANDLFTLTITPVLTADTSA